jgi:hypothetical protein
MMSKLLSRLFPGNSFAAKKRGYKKGLAQATERIEQLKEEAAARGFKEGLEEGETLGRQAGHARGLAEGLQIGRERAYYDTLKEYGMATDAPPAEWKPPANWQIHEGPFANVYKDEDCYTVRIVVNGERHVKEFVFLPNDPIPGDFGGPQWALIEALRFRRAMIGDTGSGWYRMIYEELHRDAVAGTTFSDVAMRFHKLLMSNQTEIISAIMPQQDVPYRGDDPATWLPRAAPAILDAKLPWGGECEKWMSNLMETHDLHGRTTRDLLLLTADDVLNVSGIRKKRLDQLREQLGEHNLALWGEKPPVGSDPAAPEARSIMLDAP